MRVFLLILISLFLLSSCSTKTIVADDKGNTKTIDTANVKTVILPYHLKNMVYFPAGSFNAGEFTRMIQKSSAPALSVSLNEFLMDSKEVSNGEYKQFLRSLKQYAQSEENAKLMLARLASNSGKVVSDIPDFINKIKMVQSKYKDSNFKTLVDTTKVKPDYIKNVNNNKETLSALAEYISIDSTVWKNDLNEMKHYFKRENYPVVGITWIGAKCYAAYFAKRLPTEFEFEYAMRNGTENKHTTFFPWIYDGRPISFEKEKEEIYYNTLIDHYYYANYAYSFGDVTKDKYNYTAPVDVFQQGLFGLYNLAGNVSEYCEDDFIYNAYHKMKKLDDVINPVTVGKERGHTTLKAVRGGSWRDYIYKLRANYRDAEYGNKPKSSVGFRCVMDINTFKDEVGDLMKKVKLQSGEKIYVEVPDVNEYERLVTSVSLQYQKDKNKQAIFSPFDLGGETQNSTPAVAPAPVEKTKTEDVNTEKNTLVPVEKAE